MKKVNIIFGPKTKLGTQITRNLLDKDEDVLLVARDSDDVLMRKYREYIVKSPVQITKKFDKVNVFVCAFSKIHPTIPDYPKDINDLLSDGDRLFSFLDYLKTNADLRVVYISSILELGARKKNSYYMGLKNISNNIISSYCEKNNITCISLLPGRLVEGKRLADYRNFLHTTYSTLTEKCIKLINEESISRSKVIGLDSRIYLVMLSFSILLK